MVCRLASVLLVLVLTGGPQLVQAEKPCYRKTCPPPCPPPCPTHDDGRSIYLPGPSTEDTKDAEAVDLPQADEPDFEPMANQDFSPPPQTAQGPTTQATTRPNMIGDFRQFPLFVSGDYIPAPGTTRLDLSQNFNPVPQNRVYVNYHRFSETFFDADTNDRSSLNSVYLGYEEAFGCDNDFSIDVRLPFVFSDMAGNDDIDGIGNLSVIAKSVLLEDECSGRLLTGGIGLTLPTGRGTGTGTTRIQNESYFLTPYLAAIYSPHDSDFFMQQYISADFTMNGNTVTGASSGDLSQQHLLKMDTQFGRWWYRNMDCGCTDSCVECGGSSGVQGVASLFEVHYTYALNEAQTVGAVDANIDDRMNVLNVNTGFLFDLGSGSLTTAVAIPCTEFVGSGPIDKLFDVEYIIQYNYYF